MPQYQYLVVPFVGELKRGVFSVESASTVSQQLQDVINQYGQQGWEFYRLDDVDVQVKPGCLASLLGASATFLTFNQIIFRRPPAEGS